VVQLERIWTNNLQIIRVDRDAIQDTMKLLKRQYGTDGFDDWVKQNDQIKFGIGLL
jgi:hypothetical protein